MSDAPDNAWLQDVINRAKASALPLLVRSFVDDCVITDAGLCERRDPDEVDNEIVSMVDAIELSLLSLTGDITEKKIRNALRSVSEPYAESIGAKWESVADAIIGTLEQLPPDPKNHVFDSWGRR